MHEFDMNLGEQIHDLNYYVQQKFQMMNLELQ